jgi:asparagine synthase (glutamine-hydrolysing)
MCGICGLIDLTSHIVQETQVREMMRIQKHRGPDDDGIFIEENVGFGFVRLSILDLSAAGHQPMFSEDQRYVIVYNGEIFNYIELRTELKSFGYSFKSGSDTEVLIAAFRHWGEDCLHRFNGMWAFVIYDRFEKRIFASRDRYGIKPFYYLLNSGIFAFASEIPPLLTLLPGNPDANELSIFDFLVFNRTDQNENTFFEGIKKLQHGHTIRINLKVIGEKESIKINKWYDLRLKVSKTSGFSGSNELKELFSDSVGLRLRSDVPVGVCLSGGLDSSSIVSVLLKDFRKDDLNTFSAVYSKGQTGDESEFIGEYDSVLNNMFFITPDSHSLLSDIYSFVKAHAEPIPSTAPYAQFKVMELARQNVVVTLDGQGADEMLAGYHYFFGYFFKDLLQHGKIFDLSSEVFNYLFTHRSLYGLKSLAYFMLPEALRTKVKVNEKGYLKRDFIDTFSAGNSISNNLYGSESLQDALLDHFEYKLEHLLKWEDRNSMWFSLEARVPFLDHRLVEKTLALNGRNVIRKGMTKSIFREAMKGTLPERIRLRKDKTGFDTPQDEWFRETGFNDLVKDVLSSGTFICSNYINRDKALKLFELHRQSKINISKEIWKWIHLELWYRQFFHN